MYHSLEGVKNSPSLSDDEEPSSLLEEDNDCIISLFSLSLFCECVSGLNLELHLFGLL